MSFDFTKNEIRFLSVIFCAIFLFQISIDLCKKLENKNDKQSSVVTENMESELEKDLVDSDFESEIDKIFYLESLNSLTKKNCLAHISRCRVGQINLQNGFFRTIIPPPKSF